jgi:plasmid stabilization system protein ParE
MLMPAKVLVEERVWEQLEAMRARDVRLVVDKMNQLADFPLSAPVVPIEGLENCRRAVVGDYCIFYRYIPEGNIVRILSVRHGRQMPPTLEDLAEAE